MGRRQQRPPELQSYGTSLCPVPDTSLPAPRRPCGPDQTTGYIPTPSWAGSVGGGSTLGHVTQAHPVGISPGNLRDPRGEEAPRSRQASSHIA